MVQYIPCAVEFRQGVDAPPQHPQYERQDGLCLVRFPGVAPCQIRGEGRGVRDEPDQAGRADLQTPVHSLPGQLVPSQAPLPAPSSLVVLASSEALLLNLHRLMTTCADTNRSPGVARVIRGGDQLKPLVTTCSTGSLCAHLSGRALCQ